MNNQIKCISLDELAGRTIQSVTQGYDDVSLLIVFTDGELIQLYASVCDDEGSIEANSFLHPDDFRVPDLAEAIGGLHPELIAQLKEKADKHARDDLIRREKYERDNYEQLRKKFDPQSMDGESESKGDE